LRDPTGALGWRVHPSGTGPELRCAVVIPARLGASRLPGKPLEDVCGRPLIEHVWRRARSAPGVDRVVVATEDAEIAEAIEALGGEVVRTGPCSSGSQRVRLAAAGLAEELVIDVQGDQPLVEPDHVGLVAATLRAGAAIVTLSAPVDPERARRPEIVKVVRRSDGRALYFSRQPIPTGGPFRMHVGIYGFRRDALSRLAAIPAGGLHGSEDLEQLGWLEHGLDVHVEEVAGAEEGIDTPEQLAALRRRLGCVPSR
jgi:3-deoxy-manno-octulosonate cytidylyltransferase (CMP-KDO synthetase)